MFYKLKTDLPTLKAGDLFYLDQNGNLCHKETGIIEYHYITLEKFPDALEKFWEPVEEEFKRWQACYGDKFYSATLNGDVADLYELNDQITNGAYDIGNYFQTQDEAQAYADYLKALAIVRDDAKGFEPDWGDITQKKWFVVYAYNLGKLCQYQNHWEKVNGVFGVPYFATAEDAKASIEKHTAEWLTIFGVKDETGVDDE